MPFSFTTQQKQTALWIGSWLLVMILMVLLGPILTPFVVAAILAYILNPAVESMCEWHIRGWYIPRPLAVVAVVAAMIAAIIALVFIVVPVVQEQLPLLRDQIPGFLVRMNEVLSPWLQKLHIDIDLDPANVKQIISDQFSASKEWMWSSVLASAKVGGTALLAWVSMIILLPVVLLYLLLDWRKLKHIVVSAIPPRWSSKMSGMAQEVDALMAQYLRGQFSVMFVLAAYYSMALGLADFDAALPLGIITGVLAFIPYVGFGLCLVLALVAGFLQFAGWEGVLWVALIYSVGQALESFILTPRLVGKSIGLHPLVVIFALLAFGQVFGFVGVLLALPSSAILSVVFKHLIKQYVNSDFYTS